jgi:hypothetical protein
MFAEDINTFTADLRLSERNIALFRSVVVQIDLASLYGGKE